MHIGIGIKFKRKREKKRKKGRSFENKPHIFSRPIYQLYVFVFVCVCAYVCLCVRLHIRQCQIHLSEAAGYELFKRNTQINGLVLHANGITTSKKTRDDDNSSSSSSNKQTHKNPKVKRANKPQRQKTPIPHSKWMNECQAIIISSNWFAWKIRFITNVQKFSDSKCKLPDIRCVMEENRRIKNKPERKPNWLSTANDLKSDPISMWFKCKRVETSSLCNCVFFRVLNVSFRKTMPKVL